MAEFIAILTAAKALGFDLTRILEMIVSFLMLFICLSIVGMRFIAAFKKQIGVEMGAQFDKIVASIDGIKTEINEIKEHVGLKKN